jgi:hypothetical protein
MDDLNDYQGYWQLCRLSSEGRATVKEMPVAHNYLEQLWPRLPKQDDRNLQWLLMQELRAGNQAAALCLRSYVSHGIVRKVRHLVGEFGTTYRFREVDILPYVLTDDGELEIVIEGGALRRPAHFANADGELFQPLSYRILESFKPDRESSLNSWTTMLTQQDPGLRTILKDEYGLLLMTPWALLNDTKAISLKNILLKYHGFFEAQCDRPTRVLTAYREVYLADRIGQKRAVCLPPTIEQLEKMLARLQDLPGGAIADSHRLLEVLEEIATHIRKHHLGQHPIQADRLVHRDRGCTDIPLEMAGEIEQMLAKILFESLMERTEKMRAAKRARFLQALRLLYIEGLTQKEIAAQMDLPRQDNVSKLLSFSKLRSGMECHMLDFLRSRIPSVETACQNPDRLLEIQSDISTYFEPYFKEDEIWRYTQPGLRKEKSQIGVLICEFLLKGDCHN